MSRKVRRDRGRGAGSWSEILMVRATSRPEAVACSSKSWMLHAGPGAGLLQAGSAGKEGSGGACRGCVRQLQIPIRMWGFWQPSSGLASPVKEIWAGHRCPLPFRIAIPFVNSFHQVLSNSSAYRIAVPWICCCAPYGCSGPFRVFAGRTPCSGPA